MFLNFLGDVAVSYESFLQSLPENVKPIVALVGVIIIIIIYSIFIWKFYQFIAKKDIIKLNLNQYNRFRHNVLIKISASLLYFLEYIIILPFLVFFWFVIFSLFLLVLIEASSETANILLISAAVISAIRVTAYYSEDLSKDLAKVIPFTLLAIALITPNFFDISRFISRFGEIPSFINSVLFYLVFIIVLEVVLRILDFVFSLFLGIEEAPD